MGSTAETPSGGNTLREVTRDESQPRGETHTAVRFRKMDKKSNRKA